MRRQLSTIRFAALGAMLVLGGVVFGSAVATTVTYARCGCAVSR